MGRLHISITRGEPLRRDTLCSDDVVHRHDGHPGPESHGMGPPEPDPARQGEGGMARTMDLQGCSRGMAVSVLCKTPPCFAARNAPPLAARSALLPATGSSVAGRLLRSPAAPRPFVAFSRSVP